MLGRDMWIARRVKAPASAGALVLVLLVGCRTRPPNPDSSRATEFAVREDGEVIVVSAERTVMGGVPARVHVALPPGADGDRARQAACLALDEIDRVESVLSPFRTGSDIARLSEAPAGEWVELGRDALEVLSLARELWAGSGGAFDVTVGPLMLVWGFHGRREPRVPTPDELARAMESVGMQRLELDALARRARKLAERMRIDTGAIAKGYAVDRAAEVVAGELAHLGAGPGGPGALVEIGGEIVAIGEKAPGRAWTVGLERPRTREIIGKFPLPFRADLRAVASSADSWQYFVHEGRRYSHIVDPRTGMARSAGVIGATVLAADCATADGLATALCVLEPAEGLALARDWHPGAEALVFVEGADGGVALQATSGFPEVPGAMVRRGPTEETPQRSPPAGREASPGASARESDRVGGVNRPQGP